MSRFWMPFLGTWLALGTVFGLAWHTHPGWFRWPVLEAPRQPEGIPITLLTTGYHCPRGSKHKQCDIAQPNDGLTATMTPVRKGVCAADWRVFPPGTKFWHPLYGYCVVQDSGARIKLLSLDLYFEDNAEAIKHGSRLETVYLIRWGAE